MMSGFIDDVSKLASLSYSPRFGVLRLDFKSSCNDQTLLEYPLSGAQGKPTSGCVGGPRGAHKEPAVEGVVSHSWPSLSPGYRNSSGPSTECRGVVLSRIQTPRS